MCSVWMIIVWTADITLPAIHKIAFSVAYRQYFGEIEIGAYSIV